MFTGIITGQGHITEVAALGATASHGKRLVIRAPEGYLDDVGLGDSIALNGACMTVTTLSPDTRQFTVDISAESLLKTTGLDTPGPINMEKALRANDRLGGHLVSGHVDGVGRVVGIAQDARSWRLRFETPPDLARYVARKGSIAIDGVSLTVNEVEGREFGINIIPHTWEVTTIGGYAPGRRVNLEIDPIARYVERLLAAGAAA